jgi:isocitrate/isopropylmalate dehydrogenase
MFLGPSRLDSHANAIADSVFDVINSGKVKTPDMGGTFSFLSFSFCYICLILSLSSLSILGTATTSDFTTAVTKNL